MKNLKNLLKVITMIDMFNKMMGKFQFMRVVKKLDYICKVSWQI